MSEHETGKLSTTCQLGKSENCEDDWWCDESTLMQFWTELDVDWTSFEILTKMIGKLRRLKGNFSVENFWQSIDGTLSWCSIGDIPAEARFLENM